jgi:hypothetical protein
MFKMILSAIVALGMGSVAFANDPAPGTGTTDPAATTPPPTPMPDDAMKKAHGDHKPDKKMADMKKAKKAAKKKDDHTGH